MDIGVTKYFNNAKVKKIFEKYVSFDFLEIEGETGTELGLNLMMEMPSNLNECGPEVILHLPARYAFYCRVRDLTGSALRKVQRARKNERSMLYNSAANPDETQPDRNPGLKKVTEKAIEAWIETRADVMQLNMDHDTAETNYTIMCSACEALRMYMDALKEVMRQGRFEEQFSELNAPRLTKAQITAEDIKSEKTSQILSKSKSALLARKKKERSEKFQEED